MMKRMKAVAALVFAFMMASVAVVTSTGLAFDESSVGVKEDDWIEYDVSVAGTGSMPPTHDVRWMRMDVLPVQGEAFSVNLTSRYANGTVGSAVWKFNFTEGNVEGWIIIPANLSAGDSFYDYSIHTGVPVNVTVEGEEQKTVCGTTRTVTYGHDALRHKEWDKATGVFIGTTEVYKNVTTRSGWYIEDVTVTVKATATNMWSSETSLEQNQTVFWAVAAIIVVLAVAALIVVARRKRCKE
jgi:hypothetical protein